MDRPTETLEGAVHLITSTLAKLKCEYNRQRESFQYQLRRYVTDTQYSLARRFMVWATYCDKDTHDSCLHTGDFGLIGDWMHYQALEDDLRRGVVYTWRDLLEEIVDRNENEYEKYGNPIENLTVEEFKEILIKQNFGHFTHDW